MKSYAYLFIEKYGHGSHRRTDRTDIVTIRDSDDYYYVYEAETEKDAAKIADWFCTAADEQSNCNFHKVEGEGREYFVSVIEPMQDEP